MNAPATRRLVILTEGQWHVHNAKTAMGVIRYGMDRVVALLDSAIVNMIDLSIHQRCLSYCHHIIIITSSTYTFQV